MEIFDRTQYELISYGLALLIVLVTLTYFVINRWCRMVKRDYPPNSIVVRSVGVRGPYAPSMLPFTLKLETFLRMANLPYYVDYKLVNAIFSQKKTIPWMTYDNTQDVCDSQSCIDWLSAKYKLDFNRALSAEQRAVARAFRKMTEDHLLWTLVMFRFVRDPDYDILVAKGGYSRFMIQFNLRQRAIKNAYGQGMGRNTDEEITASADADLRALSVFLGKKSFLFGEEPCETDCSIFGILAQFMWHLPGKPQEKMVKETYPNLGEYCERIKARFWPDWDEWHY